MQKKHLHWLLLILLVAGCGGQKSSEENPYLVGNKAVGIGFRQERPAPALPWGPAMVRATDPAQYSEPFTFQSFTNSSEIWASGLEVAGFDRHASRIRRSLASLTIEDTSAGLKTVAVPLPHGVGVAFYLEGETYSPVIFHLSSIPQDTLFLRQNEDGPFEQYLLEDSSYLVITAAPEFEDQGASVEHGRIERTLSDGTRRQVVAVFDRSKSRARSLAEAYRGMKRRALETSTADSLNAALAFSLNTQDERTNGAFALLAASLAEAQSREAWQDRAEIEQAASLTPAMFLASRARPEIVFRSASAKEMSQRVRWGLEAYRAALYYGMADADSLKEAGLLVLAEAARVHEEYSSDLFALGDDTIPDTLVRLAVAHVRYAELLALCGDISLARGSREAELSYRTDATRAGKNARRYFEEAGKLYHAAQLGTKPEPDKFSLTQSPPDSEEDPEELVISGVAYAFPPDTLAFVQSGAHYGFSWISEKPTSLIPAAMDGFSWQKWTAFRFANDYKIIETPDLDSTFKLLLDGPLPGTLSDDPGRGGEPSLAVMGAAFENLAVLYLGYHPNWMQHRVDLEPRQPQVWGHTVARLPFGPGFLHLDYNFANEYAAVGISDLNAHVDVFFGFPLPTGGFTRTQFVLSPEQPRCRVWLKRDSENRVKLDVKPEGN